ncbi:hypothetical protein K1J57_10165 [Nocardiopsis sp. MT53]|uniref:Uncharacterized protein n=1 Tax=Nocardiopsis changdeensis TaxID=2831969 RepID=A0ABX8BXY1_9ACTN|nr:hypothetical protein KGD84_00715 [Nocardiopsis changdeensis]QYX40134.1 hypothetical protein K1J57_10165 [Nocardiopsis sp. MT53]
MTDPDAGTAYDLTDAVLELVIKDTVDQLDTDPATVILSTTTGEITVVNAAQGLALAMINRGYLATPGDLVWRLDVVRAGTRRTAIYGPLRVTNL